MELTKTDLFIFVEGIKVFVSFSPKHHGPPYHRCSEFLMEIEVYLLVLTSHLFTSEYQCHPQLKMKIATPLSIAIPNIFGLTRLSGPNHKCACKK